MENIINKHEKIVLMFSGGKDSIACLFMLRPFWDKITVLWLNTGNSFPETLETIANFRKIVPNFIEIKSDVLGFKKQFGEVSDIVVSNETEIAEIAEGKKEFKTLSPFTCCSANIWYPTSDYIKKNGFTLIVRGQRSDENQKAPIKSGHIEDGIEYLFPIENWSSNEVLSYIENEGFNIPEHFYFEESSLDCMNCTGFLRNTVDRQEWMKKNHPEVYESNKKIIGRILQSAKNEINFIEAVA